MDDHINLFHRGIKQEVAEEEVRDHLEVLLSGNESGLANDFVEAFGGGDLDTQRVEDEDEPLGVLEDGLFAGDGAALEVFEVLEVEVGDLVEVLGQYITLNSWIVLG